VKTKLYPLSVFFFVHRDRLQLNLQPKMQGGGLGAVRCEVVQSNEEIFGTVLVPPTISKSCVIPGLSE